MKKTIIAALLSSIGFFVVAGNASARAQEVSVTCSSEDFNYESCDAGGRILDMYITARHSDASCVRGRTFGYSNRSVWVDEGCRATFSVTIRRRGGQNNDISRLTCTSWDSRYEECRANGRIVNVVLMNEMSDAACIEGSGYGFFGRTLWVDRGCRGTFEVETKSRFGLFDRF